MTKVVVLGIGNVLMSDEGVGVHFLNAFVRHYEMAEGVEIVDGGTVGMELLPELEGLDNLIVVDAVRAGKPPASVVRLEGAQVPAFFKTKISPHQVGLSDVLAMLSFKGAAPGETVLIGVQPVTLSLGMELSAEVQASLEEVTSLVVRELEACGCAPRLRA